MPRASERTHRGPIQIRPLEDRTVTDETIDWLKQTGASRDLLAIAKRAAKRARRHLPASGC
jgi:hypothetical protein